MIKEGTMDENQISILLQRVKVCDSSRANWKIAEEAELEIIRRFAVRDRALYIMQQAATCHRCMLVDNCDCLESCCLSTVLKRAESEVE